MDRPAGGDIVWFEDANAQETSLVGGKFASLAALSKVGINIPPAFSISAAAYRRFIKDTGGRVKETIDTIDFSTLASVDRGAERIRNMVDSTELPVEVRAEVATAYRELATRMGAHSSDLPVAVRSSTTVEDSSDSSMAGQHETYLWIRGEDDVLAHVLDCWASVFNSRSLRYRDSRGLDQLGEDMAVVVQAMVNSTVSGVMFTLNPANGDPSKIVIESSWGLGEAIVGGLVTPDLFVVDKVTLEILEKRANRKLREFTVRGNRVVEAEVPEGRQSTLSVSEDLVLHLAKLGKSIEKKYGSPQDIEWALDSSLAFPNNAFILQARPETVWSHKERSGTHSGDAMDMMVDKLVKGERLGPKQGSALVP